MSTNKLDIGGDNNGPAAVGDNATATQYGGPSVASGHGARLDAALAELRRQVVAHAAALPEVDRIGRDVDDLEREARSPDPDPPRMRDTIARILARVALVGGVVGAANHTRELIEEIFG